MDFGKPIRGRLTFLAPPCHFVLAVAEEKDREQAKAEVRRERRPNPANRMTATFAIAALLLAQGRILTAQEGEKAKVGDRVRVSGRLPVSGPISGTLRKLETASITILPDTEGRGEVVVDVSKIDRIERYVGSRGHGGRGLLIGVLIGAAVVSSYYLTLGNNDSRPGAAGPLAVVGAAGFLGYSVGQNVKTQIWKDVSIGDSR
jgi:hypothetical protein